MKTYEIELFAKRSFKAYAVSRNGVFEENPGEIKQFDSEIEATNFYNAIDAESLKSQGFTAENDFTVRLSFIENSLHQTVMEKKIQL